MYNKKVILICGYSRGGTNILWNIMQSHPEICSSCYETHTIINENKLFLSHVGSLLRKFKMDDLKIYKLLIDYGLYRIKMRNFNHDENRYISPGIIYNKEQIAKSAICLKSVDNDIQFTDLLLRIYPELYFISLTRNGYALAEGHLRRGSSIVQVAKLYQNIADKMKIYSERLDNFKIVRFENVLKKPFHVANELYQFSDSEPYILSNLRLKSKKIVKEDGSHEVAFGEERNKYWFDKTTIKKLLDPSINDKQISNLSRENIKAFNQYAESALRFYGYEVLR